MPIEDPPPRPISVQPARIISIGPSTGPQTGPPPAAAPTAPNPYAVDENEQTLLDHRPDDLSQDEMDQMRPAETHTMAMIAVRQPAPQYTALAVPAQHAQSRPRDYRDPRLVMLSEPDSQRSASFRLLRDNLLAKKAPRCIAVSSGAVHEGKTTCAINLAIALSEQPSTRVLLLEGNFIAPSLGRIFEIDATTPPAPHMNVPWLLPYRVVEIMRGFHVAAVVQQKGEPVPQFNSRWFEMVIGHLSGAGYDHLIIDAAALDGSPAVTQVIGAAEGTLLTVRAGGTTARTLRRAAEQIPHGRALGVTLMDSET
ncbi:MAG: hypothetical protein JWP87_4747 [Labilithrix sp.]|nr:hypothetical protein [Labilithrix sp.]